MDAIFVGGIAVPSLPVALSPALSYHRPLLKEAAQQEL